MKSTTVDRHIGLLNLAKTLSFLVVFVAGVVVGMTASSQINRYFVSQAKLYFYSNMNNHFSAMQIPNPALRNCSSEANLTHGFSDNELFWRASMVPRRAEYPFKRVPKVAFMFLTRGPLPLMPLWERFFEGHRKYFSVYVHALPGFELNVSMHSAFYKRQIPSKVSWVEESANLGPGIDVLQWLRVMDRGCMSFQSVEWGTVALAEAERRLLANALLDFSNERFVLLSESCIPIYNFPIVYKYLINSDYSFVESYDDPSRYGRGRYSRNMLPDIKLYQWRKGSQWFELSRELAVNIVADTKYYTLFKKYSSLGLTGQWGAAPSNPGAANITEGFIQALRNNGTVCPYNSEKTSVCYLFARKFAPSALEPLLNLTSKMLQGVLGEILVQGKQPALSIMAAPGGF
ncbi:hypothetical protein CK203_071019 [Vitis vinifera]|uniref:Glycosyltransferase BC10 n=1 Tax=Vitis vinifera TaxID=29760 RepID=A0A438E9M2_VITVI|nr:hypothetical protein CK203_071019 [Vitis vinifera]